MSRPLRIQYPNAVYHVMNRGLARQPVFLDQTDYLAFLNTVFEAWRRWKFEIYAYCLMGNHYHLCLQTPEGKLSRIMRHINGVYTQRFNRAHDRDGPLFRGRYKAMLIEAESYLGHVVRYIHLNPVEAHLVRHPEDYEWSSHRNYLSSTKPDWLSTQTLMNWFGTRRAFQEFVLEGSEKTIRELYNNKRWPVILGNEDFMEQARHKALKPTRDHVRNERKFVRPSLQRILEAVAGAFDVPLGNLTEGKRGEANRTRKIALWALREFGDFTHDEIGRVMGLSKRTVGWACFKVQKELREKPALRKRLRDVERRMSQQKT